LGFFEVRDVCQTWAAPGGPEIEQHIASAIFRKVASLSRESVKPKSGTIAAGGEGFGSLLDVDPAPGPGLFLDL